MKKILAMILVLSMALTLVSVAAAEGKSPVDGMTVAFIPKVSGNSFFEAANDGAQKYAAEWGLTVDYIGSPDASVTTQLELIQRIRNEGLSVKETEDAVEKILDRLYEEEDPQPKQQRQSRRVGILRDGRLVVNSLQQLMEQFNSCGFESSYKMKDKGEFFEISIKVNKVQTKIRSVG